MLRRDEAAKRSSWNKNNVRMWGKRSDDESAYGDDYVDYYEWLDQNHAYPKRESSVGSDMGQAMPNSWAGKNAWEKNNMRIWG